MRRTHAEPKVGEADFGTRRPSPHRSRYSVRHAICIQLQRQTNRLARKVLMPGKTVMIAFRSRALPQWQERGMHAQRRVLGMARQRVLVDSGLSRVWGEFTPRLAMGIVIVLFVGLVVVGAIGAVLTYYVVTRTNSQESVTPQTYLLSSYISLNFTDHYGGEHDGWLMLGLRGAPAIILCPGYESNRSDLLSLGSILRDNHYNVYIFNFHGPHANESRSDLGPRQASDLLAAIDTVTKQPDVNQNRVGVFGTSVGGYAALAAAESNPKVRAVAVDTTYTTPESMFDWQVDRLLGGSSGVFHWMTEAEFHFTAPSGQSYDVPGNLGKLSGVPKLFISGHDNPALAAMTEGLYNQAPEPKQLLVMDRSLPDLTSEAEKRECEDEILNFFQQQLSLRSK